MSAKCKHKRIKIVTVSHYKIDKGWAWLQELPDIDMADYFIEEERDRVVCEDCAEVLDR
jgi:hypothetical protein